MLATAEQEVLGSIPGSDSGIGFFLQKFNSSIHRVCTQLMANWRNVGAQQGTYLRNPGDYRRDIMKYQLEILFSLSYQWQSKLRWPRIG